jgi:cyclopropane-fatty-acyl-phospholipid synthase
MSFLDNAFSRVVRKGSLTVTDANGRTVTYGDGTGTKVRITITDPAFSRKILAAPSLALGEAYMDRRLNLDDGTIYDFLYLLTANIAATGTHPAHEFLSWLGVMFRRFQQYNPVGKAKQNVAHHYDLSGELYELFLDVDRQYSCAYFAHPSDTIDVAQENKKRHIAAKLCLKEGVSVLDIGSGWGGLGLYIAEVSGAHVTGVTLSEEQYKISNERAAKTGLQDHARFLLEDYREHDGKFDRIVSVGMLLKDDGVALLHTIGRLHGPCSTDPWIRKYIFPGGYIPALSEIAPHVEKVGLVMTDLEFLGRHYAETLRKWQERFQANRERVKEIYDERFCRMWEFYLAGSEISFRNYGLTIFQIQLAKDPESVPMTRDYIGAWEASHPGTLASESRAA